MGIQDWSERIVLVNLAPEPQLSEELDAVTDIVSKAGDKNVVIDFSSVEIITSSSLAKLLKLRKVLVETDHKVVFCGVSVKTKAIFLITGLETVFEFTDDQFMALASLQIEQANS